MSSWDAISNYMGERQDNRDMGQNDHVRIGPQGFVYTDRQPLTLSEDQPDEFGSPGIITGGGGLDEQIDTRPSLTQGPEPTWRDTIRNETLEYLKEEFGWNTQKARKYAETLWGTSGDLAATAFGIGVADLLPPVSAPLTMQEGIQTFGEGYETGSGEDMAIGAALLAAGAVEAIPVIGHGFKMLNKAAQSEVVKEFITVTGDAFNRTGEITQDALIEAGEAAQARLDSMMSGTTLSANPVGAAGDALVAGAGKVARAMKPTEINEAEPAPVFYSAVANAVDALPMEKGNAAQMRAMIAKSAEVKPEEMAWIGLDDFLKGKKSVTKQEIKDFVDANQVRIEEVTKGSANRVDVEAEMANDIQDVLEAGQVFDADAQDALETWKSNRQPRFRSQYEALLEEKLRDAGDLRTVEEFREAASANVEPTQFGPNQHASLTLPGGENYREVLLRLPNTQGRGISDAELKRLDELTDKRVADSLDGLTDAERNEYLSLVTKREDKGQFRGGHYDEPNVLAHMRLNDRTGPDGEKILFVEEIQSDWHQKGRKHGYKTPENEAKLDALKAQRKKILEQRDADAPDWFDRYEELSRERAAAYPDASQISEAKEVEFRNLSQQKAEFDAETKSLLADVDSQITSMITNIPDAPLKKTWHEMSFRRIARMAAEEGYDAIAWTPGKLQIDRYEETLRRNVDEITYEPVGDGTFNMAAYKNGEAVYADEEMSLEKVEEVFGKDIAGKVKEGIGMNKKDDPTFISIKGDDLSIGGEGMKGFYDKMLKGYADKWGKKFGAKVGVTDLVSTQRVQGEAINTGVAPNDMTDGQLLDELGYSKTAEVKTKVWTLPVTKKMRDSVLGKGVATFGVAGVAAGLNNQEARPDGN